MRTFLKCLTVVAVTSLLLVSGAHAAAIPVLMPPAGSVWAFGTNVQISWVYPGPVNIVLVQGATVVRRLATGVPPQVATGLGVFMWQVPNTLSPANNYQIRAESTTNPTADSGVSAAFTLRAPVPTLVQTPFNPAMHGFRFTNDFTNDFIREFNIRTSGLCGGMSYAALDFYYAKKPIPTQDFRPAVNTPLHDYIYGRQVKSLEQNIDKWAELTVNPFGARNTEFFNWGLQGSGGGRLQELRQKIDAGLPVPLGLKSYGGGVGDHQVVAIGYDPGNYKGDLGAYKEQLRIFIYDPNAPGKIRALAPDPNAQVYYLVDAPQSSWRTYFVDSKYDRLVPPTFAAPPPVVNDGLVREVRLAILTGGDDLRGGNDNVDATLHFRNLPARTWPNINGSRRWIDNYQQTVSLSLSQAVRPEDILGVTLATHFGGGIGGDNWNVNRLEMSAVVNGKSVPLLMRQGTPLYRFTGGNKTYTVYR
jgi:hypothetical protein